MLSVFKVNSGNASLEPRHERPYLAWEDCLTEQQYLTMDPVRAGESIVDEMVELCSYTYFKTPQSCFKRLGLLERAQEDPFGKLPTEIVCEICEYLPYEELRCLSVASVHVTIQTSHRSFWKRFIWRTMPWLGYGGAGGEGRGNGG
jgi:hypothetical protein